MDDGGDPDTKPSQHCTSTECPYVLLAHTAAWCGYAQPRRCGCVFCYPD
jgi:hypothetical protein